MVIFKVLIVFAGEKQFQVFLERAKDRVINFIECNLVILFPIYGEPPIGITSRSPRLFM